METLGIHSDGVGTTKLADAFDPRRPLNPLVKDAMQQIIEQGYRRFIKRVADGRNMTPEDVEKVAQGRVFTGAAAVQIGLVDKLGSLTEAVSAAASKAGLDEYGIMYIEKPLTSREKLIQSLNRILLGFIKDSALDDLHASIGVFRAVGKDLEPILRFNDPLGLYAYCITCDVQ